MTCRLLLLLLACYALPATAQDDDRRLELTHGSPALRPEATAFLNSTFSATPRAFFLNLSAWGDGKAWEVRQEPDGQTLLIAARLQNAYPPQQPERRLKTQRYTAVADTALCPLLNRLFCRALALAEDADGYSAGLDGHTCYFTATDSIGTPRTAQKWSPLQGSLIRRLADLGDSIFYRIARQEASWASTRDTAAALLRRLEAEPLPGPQPAYKGIWRLGLQPIDTVPLVSPPRFPGYDKVETYLYHYMIYPPALLAAGQGGYTVCQFTIDTLGYARSPFVLEESHAAFSEEVKRLIADMPHWLPARDGQGRARRCMYCVYISFRPYRYQAVQKFKKEDEEMRKNSFVDYDDQPRYPGGASALMQFIRQHTQYPPAYRGTGRTVRVVCQFTIDEYGLPKDFKIVRGSGIADFDAEALRVLRLLPRWERPKLYMQPRPHFTECTYTIPVQFKEQAGP